MPIFPLGAHTDERGARFAVASTSADAVEVCLVDEEGGEKRVELTERTFGVWHGHVPGVVAGQRYGYRVHGPYRPWQGLRANPAKILVDPYARRITGRVTDLVAARGWVDDPMIGPESTVDSLGHVPLSVVTAPDVRAPEVRPDVPWAETVVAEVHVRGWTMCHPEVPPEHRGTYLGLAHPAVVEHLRRIGVTAVELLPVTAIADEPPLLARGMPNYWGYATLGFLAPHAGYASVPGQEIAEFRAMVDALHAAGIEVVLDIVPNHTAEGGVDGTTLSYRGLDAPAYYALGGNGHDADITGTGNTLDAGSPTVIRLVCDAMRHWVTVMGADGFRIDLASVLGPPARGHVRPARAAAHRDRRRPGAVARQADRRAVGRHGRGLPRRRVRRGVVGVERALPRRRARLLARPRRHRRGRLAADRQLRHLRGVRAAAVGVGELRDRARRVHPARPRLLRPQAQRGQRRGQPGRHERQPLAELRGGGRDGLTRGARTPAGDGAGDAGHAAAVDGHADAGRRGRAVAHPGRQQQRLLPRRRHVVGRLERRPGVEVAGRVRGAGHGDPAVVARAVPRHVPPRRRGAVVAPGGGGGSAATTGTTAACTRWACCGASGCCCCTAGRRPCRARCPRTGRSCRSWTAAAWTERRRGRACCPAGRRSPSRPAPCSCSGPPDPPRVGG